MTVTILHGDMLAMLPTLEADSIDSCVTDPPYHLTSIVKRFSKTSLDDDTQTSKRSRGGLDIYAQMARGFMGKQWDGGDIAMRVETWSEVFRVLKPGAHLLAFGGTRTFHRMVCAIEDAGFEVRDSMAWLYGCLDTTTEAVTPDGVKPYHKLSAGDPVLCYDPSSGAYSYQPVLEVVEYDYDDTAFRIIGDFGEQVVTRNHRCIVEHGGVESFQFAEEAARECEARVPVLESLRELQDALCGRDKGTGCPQKDVLDALPSGAPEITSWQQANERTQGQDDRVSGLPCGGVEARCVASQGSGADVFDSLQWGASWSGVGRAREQGAGELATNVRGGVDRSDDGSEQSSLERRSDLSQPQGKIRRAADQVYALSSGVSRDGPQGWIRDGASPDRGPGSRAGVDAVRNSPPSEPQGDREREHEPDAFRDERGSQGIRAWRGHRSAVVRIVPFHLTGKVWCLRVPTGAFVAVRGGVAFPTGNSGFPKSLDVSKAIDKAAGAEREVVGSKLNLPGYHLSGHSGGEAFGHGLSSSTYDTRLKSSQITEPATDAAAQWQGWGTALKPAMELICVARKPLSEATVAANVLRHGTGALNIDASRIPTDAAVDDARLGGGGAWRTDKAAMNVYEGGYAGVDIPSSPLGRWPANVCHDGSEEVVALFPKTKSGAMRREVEAYPGESITGFLRGRSGPGNQHGDAGSAARFFYTSKADKTDRLQSKHPTVKPVDLIRWLVRLVTPPGGTVLDCFAGSGTTGMAALAEGFNAVLVEREAEYVSDIRRRVAHVEGADTPLFA